MTTRQGFNLNRMRSLADRISNVVATVTDYQPISQELARVAITLSTANVSQDDAAVAISRALQNHASPVLGSFREVPGARVPTIFGFVRANREVLASDDERVQRLEAQTASVLMDPTDESLWQVVEAGGLTTFVRTDSQDLHTTLASVRQREIAAPRLELATTQSTVGEFMSYVTLAGELRHGFVCASDNGSVHVLPDGTEDLDVISEDQVVEAHTLEDIKEQAAAVGVFAEDFDSRSASAMKEYYSRMYSYAPSYVSQISQQIDQSAAV